MLFALALTGLIQAQSPVILEHRIPATTQLGWSGTALVGGDGWRYPAFLGDVGGPAGELRSSAAVEYGYDRTEVWAQAGGVAELWTNLAWLDMMRAEVGLRNASGPGVAGGVRASLSQGWQESTAGVAVHRPGLRFSAGPLVRSGGGLSWPGVRTDASLQTSPNPRWSIWAGWTAAVYTAREGPTVLSAYSGAQYGLAFDTRLGIGLSALGTLAPTAEFNLGLPAGQSQIYRGDLWLRHWFTRSVAFHGELGGEVGTGGAIYQRFRALVGFHLALGRVSSPPVDAPTGEVMLRLEVEDAVEVFVAGTFTAWEPLPMVRRDGVWQCVITLPPGEHEYIYLVDGVPVVPPEAPSTRDDGFGGQNGVLVVGDR